MKIQGNQTITAPREKVFRVLVDPQAIARLLPGCEELEPAGADTYDVKLKLGIAALSGSYQGTVKLAEQRPPERLRLEVTSRGPWGFADGAGTLELEEKKGKTLVHYAGEVKVGGMIASIGQRLLEGAARLVIGQFFKNLEKEASA
ncbi:MAG: carbon monoxide dehydrogenase subunit G [Acidobacteria bacterium]|nr:carbon monoxide dehydrogenase subunit G [Acidobacteriota bacterium]